MIDPAATVLLTGAASVALLHTVVGVDHYLPFILIGKARNWRLRQTLGLTALCGLGHVMSSMVLGLIGVAAGVAVSHLEWIEGSRGGLAAWALIIFGLVYAAYSARKAWTGHAHTHVHADGESELHTHPHTHHHEHAPEDQASISRWSLFIIFVLGPCEAMIPMFIAPAMDFNWGLVFGVALIFSFVTILTMMAMVTIGALGLSFVRIRGLERYANTLAGLAIASSGLAIQLLGI